MKSQIGLVVIALATASTAFAQSRDPAAASTAPGYSQDAQPSANSAISPRSSGVQAGASGISQNQAVKVKSRNAQDQAEARITAQLNRQQLANVVGQFGDGSVSVLATNRDAAERLPVGSVQLHA